MDCIWQQDIHCRKRSYLMNNENMMEHYLSTGRHNDKMYVGVADGSRVVFTELPEF